MYPDGTQLAEGKPIVEIIQCAPKDAGRPVDTLRMAKGRVEFGAGGKVVWIGDAKKGKGE